VEQILLLAVANHIAGTATLSIPGFYYATLALDGAEVSGLTRKPFTFAAPTILSSTEVKMASATDVVIDTPNNGSADEAWVMTAVTGGSLWIRMPFTAPITLVAGGSKTFSAGQLSDILRNTTPAAP